MPLDLNRIRFRVPFLATLLLLGLVPLHAQTDSQNRQNEPPPSPPAAVLAESEQESPPVVKPRLGDGLYLMGDGGKLEFIPANVNVKEFLDWKKRQDQPAQRPAYSFSDVSLEGTATDNEALLTATLTIQIARDEEWVRVPLELQEAVLRKFEHEHKPPAEQTTPAASQVQAGFDGFDRRGGYHWWFQGKGQHVLTLQMLVPLKKTSGVRRIQLAVPPAASSYLRLNIPIASEQLSLETILAGANKTTAVDKQSTQVELFRLGQRLDLAWRALPDTRQVKTLLKAESELRVEPTEESILLKARQLIEPLRGSLKEVEVSLPGGFTVLELKVDGERYRPLEDFPQSPEPIKISLPAATTNRVRLEWLLQAPWPTSGQLIVEGFNVSECLRQSGEIAVVGFDGYRIVKRSGPDVYRTNVRELLGPGPILSAYQFRQQPYQLILDFQEIEPTYSVRPHLFLNMGAKQVEMLADLKLEVYRGVLQSLELAWPQFEEQGWTIDRTELPGVVEDIEVDPESGRILLPLAKRLTQGSEFHLLLRATRKIESLPSDPFPLTLPRFIASNPVRTVVVVTNQENVESSVLPVEGTETQPLSATFAEEVESLLSQPRMRDFRGPRQTGFLVRSDQQSFLAKMLTHAQLITSETRVRIALADERIEVRQSLHYDVKYEPVSQLRVMVPRSFPNNVLFSLGSVPLTFEWTGVTTGNSRQARLTLPEPKSKQFEIVAEYRIPEGDRQQHRLEIPCVRASDASQTTGRVEFLADYPSQVAVENSHWKRFPEKESPNIWTTTQLGETLAVTWSPRKESDIQSFKIRRALVRSTILPNGRIVSQAIYRPERELDHVLISLPPDQILPEAFYWNGRELAEDQVQEVQADSGTYRLEIPSTKEDLADEEEDTSNHESPALVVTYHAARSLPLNWGQHFELTTPKFPGDVWIDKTDWEIALPVDQHLFTLPEGFTPEFSWTRQGLFWTRTPHRSSGAMKTGMERSASAEIDEFPFEGNTYRFSYFGPVSTLRFSAMNRSIIVLFGAGLALMMGFLLLKIPFTRNILTVLVLVFAFAACGVWYMAPMQVLLQPAGLGLLLAIVAVLLDGSVKRQRQAHVVPLPSPEEYSGSSIGTPTRSYPDVIGSEDPTAVRPAMERSPDSQATQHRPPREDSSADSPPALIGSSIMENQE